MRNNCVERLSFFLRYRREDADANFRDVTVLVVLGNEQIDSPHAWPSKGWIFWRIERIIFDDVMILRILIAKYVKN